MASIPSNVIMLPIADSQVGSIVYVGGIAYRVVSARPSARIGYHLAGLAIASQSDVPRIGRPEGMASGAHAALERAITEGTVRHTQDDIALMTTFLDPAEVQATLRRAMEDQPGNQGFWVGIDQGNTLPEDAWVSVQGQRERMALADAAQANAARANARAYADGVIERFDQPMVDSSENWTVTVLGRFSGGDLLHKDRTAICGLHKALLAALTMYSEGADINITVENSSTGEVIWKIRRGSEPIGQIVLQAGRAVQTIPSPPELSPRRDNPTEGERGLDL